MPVGKSNVSLTTRFLLSLQSEYEDSSHHSEDDDDIDNDDEDEDEDAVDWEDGEESAFS